MKTYVKIYGPPLKEAIDALQKIAAEMPSVSHYHFLASYAGAPAYDFVVGARASTAEPIPATEPEARAEVTAKAAHGVISRSGYTLGDYDFFFEWKEDPDWNEICDLISKIDKAFSALGCKYTLTSR